MLLFFDGFDQYDASADLLNFGGWYTSNGCSPSSSVRVGAGKSVLLTLGSGRLWYAFKNVQSGNTLYSGYSHSGVAYAGSLFSFIVFSSLTGATQLILKVNIDNKFELYRGSTLLATGTKILSPGVHRYIEIKYLIASSGGIYEVKIDNIVDILFSGNTQNQATNAVVMVGLGDGVSTQSAYIDDFYVCNSAGSVNNTYLGEQRCEIMIPTSDSAVAWTRNTGASNFSAVDDAIGAPDDNTTYVSSSTSTQKDEYGLSDLTGVNAVAGVKLVTRAQKDDVNPLSFKHGIKSGATDQQATYALGVGYSNFIDIFETSDGAGTAFTPTTVNSLLSTIEVA